MNEVKLKDLLTQEEMDAVYDLIGEDDWKSLRAYLDEVARAKRLEAKGIVPGYLYYFLEFKFRYGGA